MLWIKRNLFLAVGGLIALVLIVLGAVYLVKNFSENKQVEAQLEEKKDALQKLYGLDPFPSATNITLARSELKRVRAAMGTAKDYFAPLHYERVTGQAFRALLETTLYQLHKKAEESNVLLPSKKYAFSFLAQQDKLTFAEGSFPALPEQLAEIQAICAILFDAKINRLVNVKRPRVTTDDPPGSNDYLELRPEHNDVTGATFSPYQVEFHSFSAELASALQSFYRSTNGLIVKAVQVDLAADASLLAPGTPPPGSPPASVNPVPGVVPTPIPNRPLPPNRVPGQPGPPAAGLKPASATGSPSTGEGRTVLNEKLLKITLIVDAIKPAAK